MARRIWPDHGGRPRYGCPLRASPWVQELDGPVGIKALLTYDSYSLYMISNASTRRTMRAALAAAALAAALAGAGCANSDSGNPDSRISAEQAKEPISGAPSQLASLRGQASQLLGGGTDAFDARLESLSGTPVVVNKWASW